MTEEDSFRTKATWWLYRINFAIICITLLSMSIVVYQVLQMPFVDTTNTYYAFNILFVAFVFPMAGMTISALSEYVSDKKICKPTICTYIVISIMVSLVTFLLASMLYDNRNSVEQNLRSKCDPEQNAGLLGRFEGYSKRARGLLCSDECPCNLSIPLPNKKTGRLLELPEDEKWRGKASDATRPAEPQDP